MDRRRGMRIIFPLLICQYECQRTRWLWISPIDTTVGHSQEVNVQLFLGDNKTLLFLYFSLLLRMRYLAVAILAQLSRHPSITTTAGAFVVTTSISKSRLFFSTTNVLMSSTKRVLVPIADGSEEIETTCITDTLTRFGAEVVIASVMPDTLLCRMSRGIKVCQDRYKHIGKVWKLFLFRVMRVSTMDLLCCPAYFSVLV